MEDPGYRGIVVCPPLTIDGQRIHIRQSWLDEQELRFSLLFWDRLCWPTGDIHLGDNEESKYLGQCGILERPHYKRGPGGGQSILLGQIAAYEDLERKHPGSWAMAQGDNSLMVKGGIGDIGKGAMIELIRAVPIPDKEVPLYEILKLKDRYQDELTRFRVHLEGISKEVSNSLEPSAALESHLKEINSACSDLMALGKSWQFPMHVSSFKASLNLRPSLVGKVMGAWEIGGVWPAEIAALAAAATGVWNGVKIDTDLGIRSIKAPISPYRYAYTIHKKLR